MISKVEYKGGLRTEAVHLASGSAIVTDAPVDNQGKGEAFSPTDLVATALGSCMLTIMGIVAKRDGINIEDATAEVEKIMSKSPRRIGEIKVRLIFKSPLSDLEREKLERAARTCPVSGSLHDELKETIEFVYE
jgi:uncharacterized OsmC-like protein